MQLENKKVSELEDDKQYLVKDTGRTMQLKGVTLKSVFSPDQELLVSPVAERKKPKVYGYGRSR